MRTFALFALVGLVAVAMGCASASGYDPKRIAAASNTPTGTSNEPADPETAPLPDEPKTKILDPKDPLPPAPAKTAAPAPTTAPTATATATGTAAAKPKATPPAAPAKTAAAAPAVDNDCGSKENPCPMQKLMRGSMSAATSPEQLEAAFNRVAGMSPNPGWTWTAISKKGAELAKGGDAAGAKGQCKACHDAYKEAYKSQYRGRKI